MKKFKSVILIVSSFLITIIISCGKDDTISTSDPEIEDTTSIGAPNILLIIADDMGLDATNGFSEGSVKPNTPHLDSIMNSGLKFTNLWVNPTCSPTRSSIITGKYGYRTGVLNAGDDLTSEHETLQEYINNQTGNEYATAVVGKWHLAQNSGYNPEERGIDYYAGLLSGAVNDYYSWGYTENGVTSTETEYVTQNFTNLAIDWTNEQTKPWFLWLAYTAPHTPFHLPPSEMHSQGELPSDPASVEANPLPYFMASIEAMDYQIGRLLDEIGQDVLKNTTIIFIGDNGSPVQVAQSPYSRRKSKGTVYQGGINTPMFISGTAVDRVGTDNSLVNGVDLFATIAGLAGVDVDNINDSKNLQPLFTASNPDFRDHIYSELEDDEESSWAIRNLTHKLIEYSTGMQEMFDLTTDPYENNNLLNGSLTSNEQSIKASLEAEMANIRN